jgi:ATP-binding cassette, subfamily B, bacterial PglK
VKQTVRRLLTFVEPGHRAAWLGLALLALIVTGLETASALLIFIVIQLAANPEAPLQLPIVGDPRRWFPDLPQSQVLIRVMSLIAGFFIVRSGVVLLQSYLRARTAEYTGVRLSSRLFRGYLRMPYAIHLQRNSAELIRNVQDAVRDVVGFTLTPALGIASELLVIAGLAIVLVLTAPLAAGLAAVVFAPLIAILFRIVQPKLGVLGKTGHQMNRSALAVLQQSLHGYRDIAILGRRETFSQQYEKAREQIARARTLQQFLGDVPRITLEAALILFVALFLTVAVAIGGSPQKSLAVLGMFAYAAIRVLPSLNHLVLQMNELKYGAAATAEIYRDLVSVENSPSATVPLETRRGDESTSLVLHRSIRFAGVSYRYPYAELDSLIDVDLEIRKGESMGVVGPTGGGKTTLVDVMLGLLSPTRGRVLVDDTDIQSDLEGWQRNLGVVPQMVYLLDTTLRRNIALGIDDPDIDEEAVWEAVHRAQLDGFVASLPQGLDSVVGERGLRLSGGERQRVAIARALYRRPPVLVFDEGTSALDTGTESELLRALEPLRRAHTLVIIAHRLSTVLDCDRIILVDAGRIVDDGSFHELLERNESFRRLAKAPSPASEEADATRT